ncbi:MAG: ACP S-malonyltransferase [Candidatus Brocadiaceae bacterium]|jgi:[acyl-carrier-protein] S-malonyltransferase
MTKTALLFPGQGAQAVGMGREIAQAWSVAAETFRLASELLDLDLEQLCFEGPPEALSASDIAQPAILTVSVATLRALQQDGQAPDVAGAAGLSLGEYSALVAAGALEFEEAVRLVRHRGLYMQEACEANPGTMYSILGLQDAEVERACEEARRRTGGRVWPANYNCPGQVVLSGEEDAAACAAEICNSVGARRAIELDVAGAFHTPLMRPAAEKLAAHLAAVEIRKPRFPVVANVTASPTDEPDEIRGLLLRQVTSPVRWADSMRWLIAQDVQSCSEIGPGRVLQGLLRRIDSSLDCQTVNTPDDLRQCVQTWQGGDDQ